MLKRGQFKELLSLLDHARSDTVQIPLTAGDKNGNTLFHYLLNPQSEIDASELKRFLSESVVKEHLDKTALIAVNNKGHSALYLALERDRIRLEALKEQTESEAKVKSDMDVVESANEVRSSGPSIKWLIDLDDEDKTSILDVTIYKVMFCNMQTISDLKNADQINAAMLRFDEMDARRFEMEEHKVEPFQFLHQVLIQRFPDSIAGHLGDNGQSALDYALQTKLVDSISPSHWKRMLDFLLRPRYKLRLKDLQILFRIVSHIVKKVEDDRALQLFQVLRETFADESFVLMNSTMTYYVTRNAG